MNTKHKTKELIAKTALNLLNRGSFNACRVNQIIEKCNITKGSLYFHFPEGKNQIIKESLMNINKSYYEIYEKFYDYQLSLGEILNNIAIYKSSMLEKNKYTSCSPILRVAIDATHNEKDIQILCANLLQERNQFLIQKLLKFGFHETEAIQTSKFIDSSFEGGVLLSRAYKSTDPLLQTGLVLKKMYGQYKYKEVHK